jgi:CheY-like chemotaxis protein
MLGARPAADDAPAALAVDRDAAVAGQLAGVRIVAVDDEEDALELLQDILEGAGASVITVRSAAAAAEIVEGSRPDVFISDIGMAEMNGFSLLAQIRQSAAPEVRHVPAVALTACARSEDRLEALRAGFQMHLAKPIDPEELVAAVATLARRAGSFLNLDPR